MKKINILYMHSHDTGRYVQPYGHAIATPSLQKFAEEGVLFRQAFTVNPTCSPSRAALVTGETPHSNGMLGLSHRGFLLYDYSHHIIHALKPHGYHTALSGVQHIAGKLDETAEAWRVIGYDEFLGNPNEANEKAIEFIESKPEKPFFMSVGFVETHRIFPEEHPNDDARYCLPPAPLPDTPENREDMARFKESARNLDRKMGEVLDALQENGLGDNTLVIITTDHGIAFPRMKCNLEDSGIGVMLMMRGPEGICGGKVFDCMVTHMDIFPTICDLLEIKKPTWLQGKSLLPLINGEKDEIHHAIFTEINYHAAFEPMRSVRTKEWKYIRRYDKRERPVLPNCDAGFSKTTWLNHGWQNIASVDEALYNLIFDPNEKNNMANDPKHQNVLTEMKEKLQKWMEETNDPLLAGAGDTYLPSTALLNDRDELDPTDNTLPAGER
jgi:N-sulfoglucosamine sulfohydrolase